MRGLFFGGRNHPRKDVSSVPMIGRKIFLMGDKSVMKLSQLTDPFVDIILSSLVSSCHKSVSLIVVYKKVFCPIK